MQLVNMFVYFWLALLLTNNIQTAEPSEEFPLVEFLRTAYPELNQTVDNDALQKLRRKFLCNSKSYSPRCCSCKDNCFEDGTCCIDKFWDDFTPQLPLVEYLQKFQTIMENRVRSCYKVPFKIHHTQMQYKMVDTCARAVDANNVDRCQNDQSIQQDYQKLPVITNNGFIYKNLYCARCNQIQTYATMNLTMSGCSRLKKEFRKFSGCHSINLFQHQCIKNTGNENCHDNQYKELCKMYKGITFGAKNIHCYKCNNNSTLSFKSILDDSSCSQRRYAEKSVFRSFTISFSSHHFAYMKTGKLVQLVIESKEQHVSKMSISEEVYPLPTLGFRDV